MVNQLLGSSGTRAMSQSRQGQIPALLEQMNSDGSHDLAKVTQEVGASIG